MRKIRRRRYTSDKKTVRRGIKRLRKNLEIVADRMPYSSFLTNAERQHLISDFKLVVGAASSIIREAQKLLHSTQLKHY